MTGFNSKREATKAKLTDDDDDTQVYADGKKAKRKPLTATTILNMMPSSIPAEYDGSLMEFARAIEAKLREKNT